MQLVLARFSAMRPHDALEIPDDPFEGLHWFYIDKVLSHVTASSGEPISLSARGSMQTKSPHRYTCKNSEGATQYIRCADIYNLRIDRPFRNDPVLTQFGELRGRNDQ